MRIGIIGAGHAGVSAARKAAELGAEVTLFSAEDVLPYFRPRVVALAFGLTDEESICMHPGEWYEEHGIDLRLSSPVSSIDTTAFTVSTQYSENEEAFDALILAGGAHPVVLPWAQGLGSAVRPMWSFEGAKELKGELQQADSVVVVGGGLTGVEASLYAAEQGKSTTLIEKFGHMMPLFLGEEAAAVLHRQLTRRNIVLETGQMVNEVQPGRGRFRVLTDKGGELESRVIISSVGGKPDLSPYTETALDLEYGIKVGETLATSVPGIFACGDAAQQNGCTVANVPTATLQGRVAGQNAVAYVQKSSLDRTPLPAVQMSLKYRGFQLHVAGTKPEEGYEEVLLPAEQDDVHRGVVLNRSGDLIGVQMVGSGEAFQKLTKQLGAPWTHVEL